MEFKNNTDIYNHITAHLEHRTGVIAVSQDANKLSKSWATHNKFNWTKQDVLKEYDSVEAFIKSLPTRGFTNGTKLIIRRMEGGSPKHKGEIELNFSNQLQNQENLNTPQEKVEPIQKPLANTQPMNTSQSSPPPTPQVQQLSAPVVNGLAYAQVPQHEFVDLKVKEGRYSDLERQLKKAEEDLLQCKSDLRIEKEKCSVAERKIETLDDKWELKLDRQLNDKRGFLDTDTGKEVASALAGSVPDILKALNRQPQAAVGMGNPIAHFSEVKQQFVTQITNVQDEFIPVLSSTLKALIDVDGFAEHLIKDLENNLPKT